MRCGTAGEEESFPAVIQKEILELAPALTNPVPCGGIYSFVQRARLC